MRTESGRVALKLLVPVCVVVVISVSVGLAHKCWEYSEVVLDPAKVDPWVVGSPCTIACSGAVDDGLHAAGSTAGQIVQHYHRNWHCAHCIPAFGIADTLANRRAYGLAFMAFHRQLILDFDIYRLATSSWGRLQPWDPAPGATIPGNFEDDTPFGFTFCGSSGGSRAASAICSTCTALPAQFIGNTLGNFETLGDVGYSLELLRNASDVLIATWHGDFHNGVAAAGTCQDIADPLYATRDPAFWMAHKKLDEVTRDWQRLKAVDLVIVIDRSGSMDDNCSSPTPPPAESPCKINDAKAAATLLANLVQDVRMEGGMVAAQQHRIGLVSFSNTATDDLTPIAGTALVPANGIVSDDGINNTDFENALAGIATGGNTSIAAGIREAISILNSVPDPNPHQAILVLTDGKENVSPCLGGSSPSACTPVGPSGTLTASEVGAIQIVAIGIEGGPLGGADEANLRDIAERHGGTFLAQADVGAVLTWQKFFVDAFGQIFDSAISADPFGTLLPGQMASAPFPIQVCGLDDRISLVAGFERLRQFQTQTNCDIEVRLFTPTGKLVNRFDVGVEAGHGATHDFVHVSLPYNGESIGTWRGQVARRSQFTDCPAQNYFYSTLVKGFGHVTPFVMKPKVSLGERILATFRLTESGRPMGGFDSVVANVTLRRPDGSVQIFPLFDNGANGDTFAGNNVWSVEIPVPAFELGPHELRGHFELTKGGCTRVREAAYSIVVEREPSQCTKINVPAIVNAGLYRRPQAGEINKILQLFCLWNRCASSNQYDLQISDTFGWLKTRDRAGNLVNLPQSFRMALTPFHEHCLGEESVDEMPIFAAIPPTARPGDKSIVSIRVVPLVGNQEPVTATTTIQVFPPPDCNLNGVDDAKDLATGVSHDHDQNGRPDECEVHRHLSLPPLTIARDGGRVTITWYPPTGALEQATTVTGPWGDVQGAKSPYTTQINLQTNRFFRVKH